MIKIAIACLVIGVLFIILNRYDWEPIDTKKLQKRKK